MRLAPWRRRGDVERSDFSNLSLDGWIEQINYLGMGYAVPGGGLTTTYPGSQQEKIGSQFVSLAELAFKSNAVVFACMAARLRIFSEARFQFQQLRQGGPGKLFGNASLATLETPWVGGTTGDLLTRKLMYADLAGNAFTVSRPNGLACLRPDWVTLILGSNTDPTVTAWDVDAEILGYMYREGGPGSSSDPEFFLADDVAHFAPIPDPCARFRGMSWLTPVIREIMADKAMIEHKLKFFENGATPNLAVKLDVPDLDTFKTWMELFREQNEGVANAYKTLFLAAGADATVIGTDLKQLDFSTTQGHGETRIAAAAGVPPIIVGLSEGLEAATYSNYGQARRAFADGTLWPLWRNIAGSLARIVDVPADARLWIDASGIAFLREDEKDAADIQSTKAQTIHTLVSAGYESSSVIDAVVADDFTRLQHTGLFSVQLQPAGSVTEGKGSLLEGVVGPDDSSGSPSGTGANGSRNGTAVAALTEG